jgi:hypothetical protein
MRTDRRTNMTRLMVAFRNLTNVHKKSICQWYQLNKKHFPRAMPWHQHSVQSDIRQEFYAGVCTELLFRQKSGSTIIFTDHHFTARGVIETADSYEITMKWLKPQICSTRYTTYSFKLVAEGCEGGGVGMGVKRRIRNVVDGLTN